MQSEIIQGEIILARSAISFYDRAIGGLLQAFVYFNFTFMLCMSLFGSNLARRFRPISLYLIELKFCISMEIRWIVILRCQWAGLMMKPEGGCWNLCKLILMSFGYFDLNWFFILFSSIIPGPAAQPGKHGPSKCFQSLSSNRIFFNILNLLFFKL